MNLKKKKKETKEGKEKTKITGSDLTGIMEIRDILKRLNHLKCCKIGESTNKRQKVTQAKTLQVFLHYHFSLPLSYTLPPTPYLLTLLISLKLILSLATSNFRHLFSWIPAKPTNYPVFHSSQCCQSNDLNTNISALLGCLNSTGSPVFSYTKPLRQGPLLTSLDLPFYSQILTSKYKSYCISHKLYNQTIYSASIKKLNLGAHNRRSELSFLGIRLRNYTKQ